MKKLVLLALTLLAFAAMAFPTASSARVCDPDPDPGTAIWC